MAEDRERDTTDTTDTRRKDGRIMGEEPGSWAHAPPPPPFSSPPSNTD